MKRRLNILCLVVMLVLSYSVLEQGYYIFLGAKMGAQTGLELGKKGSDIAAYKELMNLKVVNLIPSSMESFDFFIVYPLDNLYQQVRHLQLAECTSAASIGNGTGCQLLLYLCVIIS